MVKLKKNQLKKQTKKLESIVLTRQTCINIIGFSKQVYKIKYQGNTDILTK